MPEIERVGDPPHPAEGGEPEDRLGPPFRRGHASGNDQPCPEDRDCRERPRVGSGGAEGDGREGNRPETQPRQDPA